MNRETKAASHEKKTKQTRSTIKDIVICKPKPLPGPLLRYGKKSQEIKNEIKLAWTVSDIFTYRFNLLVFTVRVRVRTLSSCFLINILHLNCVTSLPFSPGQKIVEIYAR